jgi:hypothetical protein
MAEIVTQTAPSRSTMSPSTEESLAKLAATLTVLTQRVDALEERVGTAIAMTRQLATTVSGWPVPTVQYPPGYSPFSVSPQSQLHPFEPTAGPAQLTQWVQEKQHLDNSRKLAQIQRILAGEDAVP